MLNTDAEYPHQWQLPEATDLRSLREQLRKAIRAGEMIDINVVPVETDPYREEVLMVNGSMIVTALVLETSKAVENPKVPPIIPIR